MQLLDPERLAEVRALFPGEEAGGMLRELAAAIEADLQSVVAALAAGDAHAVGAASHRIGGSAQLIGATALTDAALELERHAKDRLCTAELIDRQTLESLRRLSGTTLTAIEAEIARPAPPEPYRAGRPDPF